MVCIQKRQSLAFYFLIGFVAFTGQQNHVILHRMSARPQDRRSAIGNYVQGILAEL